MAVSVATRPVQPLLEEIALEPIVEACQVDKETCSWSPCRWRPRKLASSTWIEGAVAHVHGPGGFSREVNLSEALPAFDAASTCAP